MGGVRKEILGKVVEKRFINEKTYLFVNVYVVRKYKI